MTSKTRTTIEPGDILTIELECKTCEFREVWPIGKWHSSPLQTCKSCGAVWPLDRASSYQAIMKLVESLNLVVLVQKDETVPFRVHFELTEQKVTP